MKDCPRCKRPLAEAAKFCAFCGLAIGDASATELDAGCVEHPDPLAVADGYEPWQQSRDLYFKRQSAWGGTRLIGTEPIELTLWNSGYPLRDVTYEVRAANKHGGAPYVGTYELEHFPRGTEIVIEIPSWELPDAVHSVAVRLVRAEFDWKPDDE